MNLEEKSLHFGEGIENASRNEKTLATHAYRHGFTECSNDLLDFLKANEKATVKQILEHIKSL